MRNLKRSRRTAGLVILIAFLTIGVFGFAFMGHAEGHDSQRCIVAASEEATCSKASRPLDSALFHLKAFKSFSLGAFQFVVLAVSVVFLGLKLSRRLTLLSVPPNQARYRTQQLKSSSFHYKARWLRWLALHQKTDSF